MRVDGVRLGHVHKHVLVMMLLRVDNYRYPAAHLLSPLHGHVGPGELLLSLLHPVVDVGGEWRGGHVSACILSTIIYYLLDIIYYYLLPTCPPGHTPQLALLHHHPAPCDHPVRHPVHLRP